MKVDGSCYCGKITFEGDVDPNGVNVCHCTDCQNITGSPFRTSILTPAEHFKISGTPKTFIKTAESGTQRIHAFCPDCGTPVYATAISNPATYTLRLGTLKQRAQLKPKMQIWARSALPWFKDLSDVKAHERGPA
ncbi:MAG TPA: GFA family protein [Burkholderiales bacterium]|jgi:hypothetical protein|nr:GFA family protein [Burkholderiales bacterium]